MRTQWKGQISLFGRVEAGKRKPSLADNTALLDTQRSCLVTFPFTDSRIPSPDNMCSGVFEESSEIAPVAGFQTALTVGTKIPLG